MKTYISFLLIAALFVSATADAQYRRPGVYRRYHSQRMRPQERLPKFDPTVNISVGYGFPNLDKTYFPNYYGAYRDGSSQTGPVTASLDYQFSRTMSIGAMVTHGEVSAPYWNDAVSTTDPVFTARYKNWSVLLNFVRYMPLEKVTPYLRTAVGINIWDESYRDINGNKVAVEPADLPDLAYQIGLGANFHLTKHAGLFVEAGYGKYILHGGLTVKF